MARFRQIQISFWQDDFVLNLTPEEKFFYLYLMTNSKTSACGIYELPKKILELETGYNRETVDKLLNRFVDYGKIEYCNDTKEVFVTNWIKFNEPKSDLTVKCVVGELNSVKNRAFAYKYIEHAEAINCPLEGAYKGLGSPYQVIDTRDKIQETDICAQKKPAPPVAPSLPDYLDPVLWDEFKKNRKSLRAPVTPLAERRLLKTLADLCANGHDPAAVINRSIENGWKGLFAPDRRDTPPKDWREGVL